MSLHERDRFLTFAAALPATTLDAQWGAMVAKVGGKVFCLHSDADADLVFKVGEIAFDGLTGLEGIGQAPYFAKRQWVRVSPGALEDALLEAYIRKSYELVAAKLTRKLRTELGI